MTVAAERAQREVASRERTIVDQVSIIIRQRGMKVGRRLKMVEHPRMLWLSSSSTPARPPGYLLARPCYAPAPVSARSNHQLWHR